MGLVFNAFHERALLPNSTVYNLVNWLSLNDGCGNSFMFREKPYIDIGKDNIL